MLWEMLPPFSVSLAGLMFIFLMAQILKIMKWIVNYHIGLGQVFKALAYSTPYFLSFVIPMAVSLSFGIIFATLITLFLIPCLYMLQEDGFAKSRIVWNWLKGPVETRPDAYRRDRS